MGIANPKVLSSKLWGSLRLTPRRMVLVALIVCLCIDLGTKTIVRETLAGASARYYAGGVLRLKPWENAGTLMSIGDGLPEPARFWSFTVLVSGLAASLIAFMLVKPGLKPAQAVAGSLIAGGTLSNVIDRLLHEGRVLDFINIVITPLHLMIFNLADAAIGLGAVILLFLVLRRLANGRPG
jgi:signal peptidase II